jgi:hypothetical protein
MMLNADVGAQKVVVAYARARPKVAESQDHVACSQAHVGAHAGCGMNHVRKRYASGGPALKDSLPE